MAEEIRKGHCLCGAISYEIKGEVGGVDVCHCRICQRIYGYVGAFVSVKDSFTIFDSEQKLKWYKPSKHTMRGFCSTCGSALFFSRTKDGSKSMSVLVGSIDSLSDVGISANPIHN
ncbi:MAG: GFA family protein [Patescibacteria group bacterium]